jgi:hypothetical protein
MSEEGIVQWLVGLYREAAQLQREHRAVEQQVVVLKGQQRSIEEALHSVNRDIAKHLDSLGVSRSLFL